MPDPLDPTEQARFLKGLRHTRRFLDRDVPPSVIDALIAAGRNASPGDAGSWRPLVIDDLATKRALSEIGSFTSFLAGVAVVIVLVSDGEAAPSHANAEARAADRIMAEAGRQGLGSGVGFFGERAAQARAREILGIGPGRSVWGAVGAGYVDRAPAEGASAFEQAHRSLDQITPPRHRDTRGDPE